MPALQDSINAVRVAAEAADRIKATDIVAFDVADLLGITDIMMIAGASNERQVLAVAEEIEKDLFLKCSGRQPRASITSRALSTRRVLTGCVASTTLPRECSFCRSSYASTTSPSG